MLRVCFSQPVGELKAGEPIVVSSLNDDVLKEAAAAGLRPHVWNEGTTHYVPSHDRRGRSYAPKYERD